MTLCYLMSQSLVDRIWILIIALRFRYGAAVFFYSFPFTKYTENLLQVFHKTDMDAFPF